MKVRYNVRPRQLLDVVNEIKSGRIILSPYFQRNFVWREVHRIDFIRTILMGLPFPEIFVAKGDLDVEAMITTSCIVDGQQRLSSIISFIDGELEVDGKRWANLSKEEKENFLKYEMAMIELDIKHDDPLVLEIFKRLNRTYYSLSNIEKLSTEYAPAEIMLVAKLLVKELEVDAGDEKDNEPLLEYNPNFPREFLEWASKQETSFINMLLVESPIFSTYEISRQVHLMFALNILGTIEVGIFGRNISKELLNSYSESFPAKDFIVERLNKVAKLILELELGDESYWYNKANAFSLIIALYEKLDNIKCSQNELKNKLVHFAQNTPEDYKLAAKEGVNNKKERLLRNDYLIELLNN
ncbi:DUF262 domain-containing protein [Cytobacillus firmus]|uniref:DUF262 domain-containing protein n=1 Tax=Cytobacillus firmus TaxID=1399 RepID=UPI0018CE32A4|nr:DUF262 domain-containing protein [Cytobacillus firmus]MBG9447292.1 hypothetical protein [Cytobacillus firmus]